MLDKVLKEIDKEILDCNRCQDLVEKFTNNTSISFGKSTDIVILGEAPANNGWRKSGKAWYDIEGKLLPSGKVLQRLLAIRGLTIEDTTFLEAIKCYPLSRNNLKKCNLNCKDYLYRQLAILKPKVIFSLGDSATKCILDIKYDKFKEVVGKTYNLDLGDTSTVVIPIYHPSPVNPNSFKGNEKIFQLCKKESIKY